MHLIVSWDISATGDEWKEINDKLQEQIKPYSWVRPLSTLYILQVSSQIDWDNLLIKLSTTAKSFSTKINLIMSPLMSGGRYNGLLDQPLWDEINKRSN